MFIQEIGTHDRGIVWEASAQPAAAYHRSESRLPEVKTTVDLNNLHLRTDADNTIAKIDWVDWAGEIQGLITLADGATLFFDDSLPSVFAVGKMEIGQVVKIYGRSVQGPNGGFSNYPAGRLANYSLSPDRDVYTIESKEERRRANQESYRRSMEIYERMQQEAQDRP